MDELASRAIGFLRCIEAGDVDGAKRLLGPSSRFIFPRGAEFDDLESCLADRRARYRSVHKEIEGTHVAPSDHQRMAVYVYGTLEGERLDGTPISGVRFIDRLTFHAGRIVQQDVWNDLSFV
jgi:hypothetical protein